MKSSTPPPAESVNNPSLHETIARRAHELWEQEGCGHGSHERHWREAEHQIIGTPPAADLHPAAVTPESSTPARDKPHFPPAETGGIRRQDPEPL
jgi:hypothetical protein